MSGEHPPLVRFHPQLAGEDVTDIALTPGSAPGSSNYVPPAAFRGYAHVLTERGGHRMTYRSQIAHPLLDCLRIGIWAPVCIKVAQVLLFTSSLAWLACLLALIAWAAFSYWVIFRPIIVRHSVEVHPDGLTVDGRFFTIDGFGDTWPSLQMQNDDPNRIILTGVFGSRLIHFAGVHRLDVYDRTPELLAEDLDLALDQLWGRRDFIVAMDR